ncbi:MAG: hypothetical protein Q9188_002913 [Gyalolechia gomerana]
MADNFVAEAFTLLAIGLVVIALRWVSRLLTVGFSKLAADDYLMIIAGALYSAETTVAYYVGAKWKGLANSGLTPEQRAAIDPQGEEYRLRVGGSKNQLVGWLTYTVLLWTLKFCMLIFFSRLTDGVNGLRLRIRIGAVILALTFLATFLTIILGCQPVRGHWQINPDPGNFCQPAISKLQVAVLITLNITTDIYLMSVPLPMIWASRLTPKKKWVLSVMFSGGILITVFGLLRCILILTSGENGPQQAGEWSICESFVAVIVGNLPMLYTLFQRLQQRPKTWNKSSENKRSYPLNSYRTGGSSKKAKKFHHPLSMPNDTAMDSDERIVVEPKQDQESTGTAFHHGDDRNQENGIRVQTDLHIESSSGETQSQAERRNDYTRFQDSKV